MSFISNSIYTGDIKHKWEHGTGNYIFPNGVIYKGEFQKGQFHGKGTLYYPNKGKFEGIWDKGKLVNGDYYFFDNLKYNDDNWEYCEDKDRRFNYEIDNNINPTGITLLINDPNGEKDIPEGCYGYFKRYRKWFF